MAQYYAYAGDKDRALLWLERAYAQKDTGLVDLLGEVLFRNIWGDPRYRAIMLKMKLPDPNAQFLTGLNRSLTVLAHACRN